MELGHYAQRCANAYTDIGDLNGWRKGRNSTRGYDLLTMPNSAWDDRPHERYLLVVHGHLSSAAAHLDVCGHSVVHGIVAPAVTLARAAFVESAKAAWLLEDGVAWTRRAARAHLELLGNLEAQVRRLPKRLDTGYPNFQRKQWQAHRKQLRDEVIVELFGKRALSRDRDREDSTLVAETLLTSAHLEEQFSNEVSAEMLAGASTSAPDILINPSAPIDQTAGGSVGIDAAVVARALVLATETWLGALELWVRYNAWDTAGVDRLRRQAVARSAPVTE